MRREDWDERESVHDQGLAHDAGAELPAQIRYPSVSLLVIGIPVILLLLFVYVFGGTLGAGLGAPSGGRAAYIEYVTPAILLIAIAGAAQGTAISVAMDMHEG